MDGRVGLSVGGLVAIGFVAISMWATRYRPDESVTVVTDQGSFSYWTLPCWSRTKGSIAPVDTMTAGEAREKGLALNKSCDPREVRWERSWPLTGR